MSYDIVYFKTRIEGNRVHLYLILSVDNFSTGKKAEK